MMSPAKSLSSFFLLTFTWSWSCWLLVPVVKAKAESDYPSNALFFLGGFGPSLVAIALVAISSRRTGLRAWLQRCLTWQGKPGWLVLAFLSPLAVLTLAAATHIARGGSVPPSPAIGHIGLFIGNFFLVFLVGGPLGEELGWRGFALPVMQARLGWRAASLALGVVWGVWHLPLFFILESAQNSGSMAAFFVLIVATSVFYAWLYQRSNASVLPALALHTASNSWPMLVPVLPSDADQRPYLFVVSLVVASAIWLLARRDDSPPVKGIPV